MSESEVEAILGIPDKGGGGAFLVLGPIGHSKHWSGTQGRIIVIFDAAGRAVEKQFRSRIGPPYSTVGEYREVDGSIRKWPDN
jgi:hypothetical protein